ncbi:hypothetical protein ACN24M_03095 [Streptomyces microflavus]|uniref:hypothetical protein n=1 Tax=Streptomyces microflavus TaxID=1919 RepID=UPI003B227540
MSPSNRDPTDPYSADAPEDGPGGQTCRPHSAAQARSEVELALHPLLCAPDAHVRAAHRDGVENAQLVASELITDALTRSTPGVPCILTCTLGRYEVTISVTGHYGMPTRPHQPSCPPGPHPGAIHLDRLRRRIVQESTDRLQTCWRTDGERTTTATVPLTGP